jgi:predicted aminopeptidase
MNWLQNVLLLIGCLGMTACSTIEYYWQAIHGHSSILNRQQPIAELVLNPAVDSDLRLTLQGMQQARDFAIRELALPDNNSYRMFADIERDYVIWNVIATEEFSVTPLQWCFPFAGCINYRGFFNQDEANAFAAQLQAQGKDVYVAGARAYSTLGWFADPLLNTMLYQDESLRVGVLFHELAHQQLYVQDDSAFNEAFATAVAQEGVRRWFLFRGNMAAYEAYLQTNRRRVEFNNLLQQTRLRLKQLYNKTQNVEMLSKQKQDAFDQLQHEYARLKQQHWNNDNRYDKWMAQPLNNAHLALVATYHELVPAFQNHLASVQNDLPVFYQQMEQLSKLQKVERYNRLLSNVNEKSLSQAHESLLQPKH